MSENAAQKLAEDVQNGVNSVGRDMSTYLTKLVCERISYVCVFMLAFIIMAVVLAIIENAIDIIFTLPGLGLVDTIGGIVFGIVKGILIVLAIAMFLRYTGLLLKDNVVEDSFIISKLLNNNPIANIIGI
jgi:membrane protein required for colicin V production